MILTPSKPILGFDDRYLTPIAIVLNTHTVMAIYYTGAFFTVNFGSYAIKWLGEFFCVVLLWLVIRELYLALVKWKSGYKNLKRRFLVFPLLLIPYLIISIVYIQTIQPYFDWSYEAFKEPDPIVQLVTGGIILLVDLAFLEGLHLFVELKNTKIREERLKKENLNAQLLNLKHQISPHFLVNTLNTLLYLIDTDKEKSKAFVHLLSDVYERVLEFSDKDLIPLKEELDYINSYIGLLEKRFGNNLTVEFNISEGAMRRMIVPLSIQTGIENAVKHNVVSKKRPLRIQVLDCHDYLTIENNLQKKKTITNDKGQGLKNIRNRYRLLSSLEMTTEQTNTVFKLKLPLIQEANI